MLPFLDPNHHKLILERPIHLILEIFLLIIYSLSTLKDDPNLSQALDFDGSGDDALERIDYGLISVETTFE
jgi:hypothetical protein